MSNTNMFVVIGVMDTGSGTLTWMEDFDLVGVYESESDAQKVVDEKNKEVRGEESEDDEEGEDDEEEDDFLTEDMVYEVHTLEFFKKSKKK